MPLAEDSGLIAELGELVLRTACRQARAWRDQLGESAPATVAVNVSRAQLRKPGFVEQVSRALADSGLRASALRLEITESLAAEDERIVTTLRELRALGVSLALDDFGTGYSSLSTLDQLPLDCVKLDRSFTQRMVDSPYQSALIRATLDVAASIGLSVVAEGVETRQQASLLEAAGCTLGQGWLFGHPMGADDVTAMLRAGPNPRARADDVATSPTTATANGPEVT